MRLPILTIAIPLLPIAAGDSSAPNDVGGVLICTEAHGTGICTWDTYTMGACNQLKEPYYHNVTTFAPDDNGFECFPRLMDCGVVCKSPTGCTFGAVDFWYKNKWDLSAIGWDTLMASFDCRYKKPVITRVPS
ncbi:hypothetical protein V2G26_013566 [Clonostachys chloroleuca]|uniref:Secreted protein n=1 Tax=Clonostachys chloroleuca TaxID=1926264 RepID=A0AA35M7V5_9HYPO|nr:unnamed protein product [Clonostachys chloroleuca]